MAHWFDDLKERKIKGAGSVEVHIEGDSKPTIVPLRHPAGKDKSAAMSVIDGIDTSKSRTAEQSSEDNDAIMLAMLKACIAGEQPEDDILLILGHESGGLSGKLVQRCARLLGMHHLVDGDVKTEIKRRGR